MKLNAAEHAELRAETVAQLGQDIYMAQRLAVLAGDKVATRDLDNALQDHFADGGLAQLLRTAYSCSTEVTGREFVRVVCDVARRLAEAEAERQVDAAERAAQQDPDNCRPNKRRLAIWRDWLAGGSG